MLAHSLTEATNMKTSELLTRAKKYLWDGKRAELQKTGYICHAINEATRDFKDALGQRCALGSISRDEYHKQYGAICTKYQHIREYISNQLAGKDSVCLWLHYKADIPAYDLTHVNVQEYRHRWLDHLIAEFEQKGD
jgi:hypothetical protein